jgi:hypothetical protein
MNWEDEEKISFITPFAMYCFRRMAEGLRNTGSTFARMIAKVFKEDKAISAYVDDIVVQSKLKQDHIKDLRRAFSNLRNVGLKLNPEKCIFGVSKGKWLGCLVLARGIKANLEKIDAILNMEPLTSRKLAHRLVGRLVALNRFISRFAKRGLPFFEALKNTDPFSWGPQQQMAFDDLKVYLHNLTTLANPQPSEPLLLYVAASPLPSVHC